MFDFGLHNISIRFIITPTAALLDIDVSQNRPTSFVSYVVSYGRIEFRDYYRSKASEEQQRIYLMRIAG